MRVVIEGPDGSGKSTLCEHIREKIHTYFVMLRHSQRPRTSADLCNSLNWVAKIPTNLDVVIDRHPVISEPIYGGIIRHSDLFTQSRLKADDFLTQINRVVYCRPPVDVILENAKVRPQLEGVRDNLEKIIDAYDRRMQYLAFLPKIEIIIYDYTQPLQMTFEELIFGRRR